MDTRALRVLWVVCGVAFTFAASSEEVYRFDLSLVSPDFPDLDSNPVLDGDEGQEFLFTAEMVLSSSSLIIMTMNMIKISSSRIGILLPFPPNGTRIYR